MKQFHLTGQDTSQTVSNYEPCNKLLNLIINMSKASALTAYGCLLKNGVAVAC